MTSLTSDDARASLPPLYAGWMLDALPGAIPRETAATCDDCAMCAAPAERADAPVWYDPATKCCTYLPVLPNYMVGGLLDDPDASPEGRASVEARIDAGVGVSPLGLERTPVYAMLYREGRHQVFGQARSMRCPHYLEATGGCGVWRWRESTCATWFCKYVRGATGREFWERLHEMLGAAERALARWCVLRLEPGARALEALFPAVHGTADLGTPALDAAAVDGRVDPAAYRARWGAWAGREREMYRQAAALVAALSWADVLAIGGAELALRARLTRAAWDALVSDTLPDRVRLGAQVKFTQIGRRTVRVDGYSGIDELSIPRALFDLLPEFDGRPTAEILEHVRQERRVRLEPALVRKLVDFGVLRGE